jgi:hypothetical protein
MRPVGSRLTSVELGGLVIDPQKSYTMVINAYLLGGGDSQDLEGAEVLIKPEEGPVEPDVVMEAIRKIGTISPQVEGRIKKVATSGKAMRHSMMYPAPYVKAISFPR